MLRLGGGDGLLNERERKAPALAFVVTLACATGAWAQEEIDPYALSPEQLFDASVVTVSRSAEDLRGAAAAITVITGEDIARAGVTTLPEALRLAPGVQVAQANASSWAITIRGFSSALANKLLVLIDGREVYDPLFAGVYWDIQDIALEDINRIEIIRGPGATLWGANAVNGVINVITKDAVDTQGALVTAAAGDHERSILSARFGAQSGQTSWRVFGRYADRGSLATAAGVDNGDAWTSWRGGFRMDSALTSRDDFTLQGEGYLSQSGQLRARPVLTAPYALIEREHVTARGAHLLGRWTRDFDNESQLITQAYIDFTYRDQATLEDERFTFDFETQYQFAPMGPHHVIAGARYRYSSDEIGVTDVVFRPDDTGSRDLISAFVQDEIALGAWNFTIGSKFDHNAYTGFEMQPSARVAWSGEASAAWASVSRAVRTPSELEREYTAVTGVIPPVLFPVPVSVELRPSPEFESEELTAYEIGYRRELTPGLQMDVAAFHNQYEGLAALMLQAAQVDLGPPIHLVLPIVFENEVDAQSWGVEAVLNWRAADNLNLSAWYSYLDLEMHGPSAALAINSEAAETASPRNQANVRAQWDVNDRLTLDAVAYYVDNVRATNVNSHVRFDLRAGWRLTDNVQLDLVGQNLNDESHSEFGPVEIERSLYARLTWRS